MTLAALHHRRLGIGAAALLAILVAVPSQRAQACSCAPPEQGLFLPVDGAAELPTTLSLWTFGEGIERLFVDDAEVRPLASFAFEAGRLRQWGPVDLAPSRDHIISFDPAATCDFGGSCEPRTIRTGASATRTRPAVPTLISSRWSEDRDSLFGGSSSCGETAFFTLEVAAEPGSLIVLQVDGPSADTADTLSAVAVNADAIRAVRAVPSSGRVSLVLGRSACESTWDFDAHDEAPFRLGAIDVAGQFSGWTRREVAEASGCAGGGVAGGSAWIGVAALGLVAARRRRPRGA